MSTTTKIFAGVIAASVIAGGIFYATQSQSSSDNTIKANTLTIGLEGTYAPFSYRENNELTGYDVEVATAVAKKLDLQPEFVQTKWDSLIAGLGSTRYDVVFNNVAINEEREKQYRFSTPYLYSKTVLIKKTDTQNLDNTADISGKRFAQSTSSNYGELARQHGAQIVAVPGFNEAINLIKTGRADGTLNDLGAYNIWKDEAKDTDTVAIDLSDEIAPEAAAPILNKKSSALQADIDAALAELKQDGTLKRLSEKYFDADLTEK